MAVADKEKSFIISGNGDVLEPEHGIIAIGSGGNYALAAARAMIDDKSKSAEEVAKKSVEIAADICVFTNNNITVEKIIMEAEQKIVSFSPREIVSELDRFVIGQAEAKRAVAIALRNRWRRQELPDDMREEVLPKNILMVGPTGVGKTEISRRLSKLAQAPFMKVEATKFTEVGYVGKDVEQIIRDLIEIAISLVKEKKRKEVKAKAQVSAEERVLDALVGKNASVATRESFRKRLRAGDLDKNTIELSVQDNPQMPSFEIPGMQGGVGMVSIGDIFGKGLGGKKKRKNDCQRVF